MKKMLFLFMLPAFFVGCLGDKLVLPPQYSATYTPDAVFKAPAQPEISAFVAKDGKNKQTKDM